jgi:hypothetical protein
MKCKGNIASGWFAAAWLCIMNRSANNRIRISLCTWLSALSHAEVLTHWLVVYSLCADLLSTSSGDVAHTTFLTSSRLCLYCVCAREGLSISHKCRFTHLISSAYLLFFVLVLQRIDIRTCSKVHVMCMSFYLDYSSYVCVHSYICTTLHICMSMYLYYSAYVYVLALQYILCVCVYTCTWTMVHMRLLMNFNFSAHVYLVLLLRFLCVNEFTWTTVHLYLYYIAYVNCITVHVCTAKTE